MSTTKGMDLCIKIVKKKKKNTVAQAHKEKHVV